MEPFPGRPLGPGDRALGAGGGEEGRIDVMHTLRVRLTERFLNHLGQRGDRN